MEGEACGDGFEMEGENHQPASRVLQRPRLPFFFVAQRSPHALVVATKLNVEAGPRASLRLAVRDPQP